MTIQFVITIDTEEDQWDRYSTDTNTVKNIDSLLPLQRMFDNYKAIPTYLINWPVISGPQSSQILKKLCNEHNCEIGTHCHPWNTPPFGEEINAFNSMMCNLPYDIIEQKMGRLHEEIVKILNVTPLCFRAGRWGFNSNVAKCIQQIGYEIDTSVTPCIDWSDVGGPNYTRGPTKSYFFETDDILTPRFRGGLYEVPVTAGFLQKNFLACTLLRNGILSSRLKKMRLLGMLDRMNMLNFRWLSPEMSSAEDMIKLIEVFIRNGHQVLNFSFHSTSLFPGYSPFVASREDVEKFLHKIETVLAYCSTRGFEFSSLSAIVKRKNME